MAKGGILRLVLDKWCKCYLVSDQEKYLGADTMQVVITNLLDIIGPNSIKTTAKLDGEDVENVLCLSEAHHCLYVTDYNGTQKLYWQDASTDPPMIVGMQELTDVDRNDWRAELEKYIQSARL